MQSVGTRLREARVERGLSLDDVNARTRINSKNLVAIEQDEVEQISSPFFYRSFVRQYADTIGLDFQMLSAAVESLAGHMRQPDLPGQGEHQIVRVAPLQARPKRDWSWLVPAAIFLGIIAVGSGGFAFLKYFKPFVARASVVSALFPVHTTAKAPAVVAKNAAGNPHSAPSAEEETTAIPDSHAQPVAEKIHLELAATERTWLSVSADGKPAYTGILEPTETKVLEGQDSARLRTGNAGGVNIVFNGKAIGSIGPRGKTRTVVFSRNGYAIESADHATITTNHIGG